MDEQEKANQIKRRQVGKKTLIEQRARLEDSLCRIVNESKCTRAIILKAFDELNTDDAPRHQYETDCCSHCKPDGGFTTKIILCKQPRSIKPRAKAPSHVRKAVETALKIWRAEKEVVEFADNRLVQDKNYDIFLSDVLIREMTRNVHLIKTWRDLKSTLKSLDWPSCWLNAYGEELTALVVSVAEKTKKDEKNKPTVSRVLITSIDSSQTIHSSSQESEFMRQLSHVFDIAASLKSVSESIAVESSFLKTSISNSSISDSSAPSLPVSRLSDFDFITPSTSRIVEAILTPRPRRKRRESVLEHTGSPLRSRNASPSMRNLMSQEVEIDQRTNRPRRDSAIRSDKARRENLDLIR